MSIKQLTVFIFSAMVLNTSFAGASEINALEGNLKQLQSQMGKLQTHVTSEREKQMKMMQDGMAQQFAQLQKQIQQLQGEIASVQKELSGTIQQNITAVRGEIKSATDSLNQKIDKAAKS